MHTSTTSNAHRRDAIGALAAAGLSVAAGPARSQARQLGGAGHLGLLGDSTFDNKAYVGGRPDVVTHLREQLPHSWRASLCARDGAVASDVRGQLARLPADATHLVVSVGGNDGLRREGVFRDAAASVGEGMAKLAEVRDRFRDDYRAMLDAVLARGLPTALCTIYDPRFTDGQRQRLAVAGLALFNDIILRAAFALGLPVLDLRLICDEDAHFANPIEPSDQGGGKIAAATVRLLAEHNFKEPRSEVFTGKHDR